MKIGTTLNPAHGSLLAGVDRRFRLGVWLDAKSIISAELLRDAVVFSVSLLDQLLRYSPHLEVRVLLASSETEHFAGLLSRYNRRIALVVTDPEENMKRGILARLFSTQRLYQLVVANQQAKITATRLRRERHQALAQHRQLAQQRFAAGWTMRLLALLLAAAIEGRYLAYRTAWRVVAEYARIGGRFVRWPENTSFQIQTSPRVLAEQADCAAWLFPSAYIRTPLQVPGVLFVGDQRPEQEVPHLIESRVQEASIVVCSRQAHDAVLKQVVPSERIAYLPTPTTSVDHQNEVVDCWLNAFDQAARLAQKAEQPRLRSTANKASSASARSPARRTVTLFLQVAFHGGVWQAAKNLLHSLIEVNRDRGQLHLVLGVHPDQFGREELQAELPDLQIVELSPCVLPTRHMERAMRQTLPTSNGIKPNKSLFFRGENGVLLESDAWLALVDRFEAPLAHWRPYGVVIHDMIQRYVPESFAGEAWQRMVTDGMFPTIRAADLILTTSTSTAADVLAEYGAAPEQMRLLPLAHDCAARFSHLVAKTNHVPTQPYVLNVANATAHKGAEVLLRAVANLKQRQAWQGWKLVICGIETEYFSNKSDGRRSSHIERMRDLVKELGLVEGSDVDFLGFVDDEELKGLYEGCEIVVNAARYDNGSFSMVEGAWFGKHVISTCYPAAECLDERFGTAAHFFEVNSPESLAQTLLRVRQLGKLNEHETQKRRVQVSRDEVRLRIFGLRLYEMLVELAHADESKPQRALSSSPVYAKAG